MSTSSGLSIPATTPQQQRRRKLWQQLYSKRHRLSRILKFPRGVASPAKVRIYRRGEYHLLQWWEPSSKQTQYLRVEGDLLDAMSKAREIDQRLLTYRHSGHAGRSLKPADLVDQYVADLASRANAGSIAVSSVNRFRSALRHYTVFLTDSGIGAEYGSAHRADRNLALKLSAWLKQRPVARNGRAGSKAIHAMQSSAMVSDVVRAMYEWAADPQRGNLLPTGFVNPFRGGKDQSRKPPRNPIGEPDITLQMAADLLQACDGWQLKLFAPMVLWGLRPGETAWMFHEHIDRQFLRLQCIEALGFLTKGVRDKSLPILEPMRQLLVSEPGRGLILLRRAVVEGHEKPFLLGKSLSELIMEYNHRVEQSRATSAQDRQAIRDQVLHDAGGVTYKMIQGEFTKLAARLKWPGSATMKDLRHLCQTALDNGGLTREERQYLLGQSLGQAAITAYIHINKLPIHYQQAVEKEMPEVLAAIQNHSSQALQNMNPSKRVA